MPLLSIPFTTLQLVGHSAGGAILRNASGYIANTYVGAEVVGAFATAGSALQAMSSSTVALAANPYVVGAVTIAAVAIGTYCYFYGIPAPIAKTLVHAGLATPSKKGQLVAVPKLATALVLLGAAGYVAYRFYANLKALQKDREEYNNTDETGEVDAQRVSESYFGPEAWSLIGEAVWKTKEDIAAVGSAAIDRVTALTETTAAEAGELYRKAHQYVERAFVIIRERFYHR